MELNEEFIKTNELNETQVKALTDYASNHVAELKKEWDGLANTNAENIIAGAGKATMGLTGIQKEEGEKWATYLERANDGYFKGSKASIERKEKELEEKIKAAGTDEGMKIELEEAKQQIDNLKKIEAEHDEFIKGDYKNLYEKVNGELSETRKQVAFGNVKPKFADDVNEFEVKAKWESFKGDVLDKYDITLDDQNEAFAVDKENNYKSVKLADLVKENKDIQELTKGRQQTGIGSTQKKEVEIEGVPFRVPEGATPQERQKAITDYIVTVKKFPRHSQEYSKLFGELNTKILGQTSDSNQI